MRNECKYHTTAILRPARPPPNLGTSHIAMLPAPALAPAPASAHRRPPSTTARAPRAARAQQELETHAHEDTDKTYTMVNTVPKVEVLACAVCRDFIAGLGRLIIHNTKYSKPHIAVLDCLICISRESKSEWVQRGQGALDTVWGGGERRGESQMTLVGVRKREGVSTTPAVPTALPLKHR